MKTQIIIQQNQIILDVQEKRQLKPIQILQYQGKIQKCLKRTPSQFIQKYHQYMNHQSVLSHDEITQIKTQLQKNGIFYHQKTYNKFSISYFPNSKNYEVLTVTINIGYSQFRVTILNMLGNCPFRKMENIGTGNHSEIYIGSFKQQDFAIKVILIKQQLIKQTIIQLAIKEYCFFKFCSALQCGPLIKGYLGFDLIVYDNCILFAMQKVNMTPNLKQKYEMELKKQLSILHKFKMVHLDIKPENISYSPHFQKEVFIDFGLSQFLEEELGQKTQIQFRGSIKFCGEQMLKLFISGVENSEIDLYYNDIQCLQKTILEVNESNEKPDNCREQNEYEQLSQIIGSDQQSLPENNDMELIIFIILFKYHMCFLNHEIIIQLISKPPSLDLQDYRDMLKFIKKLTPFLSLRQIYNEYFTCFKNIPQYKQISQYLTVNSGAFYYQKLNTQFDYQNEKENFEILQNRFENFHKSTQFLKTQFQNIKISKLQFITTFKINCTNEQRRDESKHIFFDHFLDCIRFDSSKYNFSMQQKNTLSQSFANLFFKSSSSVKQSLMQLQNCLVYLLQYCLNDQQKNNWKKKSLFLIIQQSIYLDIDLIPFLSKLYYIFHGQFLAMGQKIILIINNFKVISLLNFKHLSKNCKDIQTVLGFFIKQSLYLNDSCLQTKVHQQSQQHILLQILKYIERQRHIETGDSIEILTKQIMKLDKICDYQLADQLKKYIFYLQMSRNLNSNNIYPGLKIFDIFKASITQKWMKQTGFQIEYYLAIGFDLMSESQNRKQIIKMAQRIQNVINCEEVSSLFKFSLIQFINKSNYPKDLIQRYIQELKKSEQLQSFYCLNIQYFRMAQILKQCKEANLVEKESIQIFNSINVTYFQCCDKIEAIHQWEEQQFQSIRRDAIVFAFKQKSSNQTIAALNMTVLNSESLLSKIECQQCKKKMRLIQSICKGISFIAFHEYEQCYFQFQCCLALALQFNFSNLAYYFLGNLVTISNRFSCFKNKLYNQLKSYLYHNMFYRVNRQNNMILNYFSIRSCHLIYFALQAFHIQGFHQQILRFLVELAEIITIYPFSVYIEEWCNNLIRFNHDYPGVFNTADFQKFFPKICWKNCYLICYYFFCLGSTEDRPILQKINSQLQNISNFSKSKLLNRYYRSCMALKEMRPRQKKWIEIRLFFRHQQDIRASSLKKVKQLKSKKQQNSKMKCLFTKLNKYLS